jgi:hypothetical protein
MNTYDLWKAAERRAVANEKRLMWAIDHPIGFQDLVASFQFGPDAAKNKKMYEAALDAEISKVWAVASGPDDEDEEEEDFETA